MQEDLKIQIGTILYREKVTGKKIATKPLYTKETKELINAREKFSNEACKFFCIEINKSYLTKE